MTTNAPGDEDLSLIHSASKAGDLETVTSLVEKRQNPAREELVNHGLIAAVSENQAQVARYLLEKGGSVTRAASSISKKTTIPVLEAFLDHGWDINAPVDKTGGYALPRVVANEGLVRWLLDHGADPNIGPKAPSSDARTDFDIQSGQALNRAAASSTTTVFELLLEKGARLEDSDPLHAAATCNADGERIPMMAYLLKKGVDINSLDDRRGPLGLGTPLHHAVRERKIEKARFLLENGADPHVENNWQQSSATMIGKTSNAALKDLLREYEERKGKTES
ncbi:MAG: hypothetical protein M1825_003280 [Sarcosagium campestre]|nr:MAG: hypothetical protein M1825_003280 [Sarcosagium campestre]